MLQWTAVNLTPYIAYTHHNLEFTETSLLWGYPKSEVYFHHILEFWHCIGNHMIESESLWNFLTATKRHIIRSVSVSEQLQLYREGVSKDSDWHVHTVYRQHQRHRSLFPPAHFVFITCWTKIRKVYRDRLQCTIVLCFKEGQQSLDEDLWKGRPAAACNEDTIVCLRDIPAGKV
jgi:hypothetical protein